MKIHKKNKHQYVSDCTDGMDFNRVASACECTGLIPTPPDNADEVESYKSIYSYQPPFISKDFKDKSIIK